MIFYRIDTERNLVLSEQTSVFRINCVDCLDRTNVVQAAIAKNYVEIMVRSMGLFSPREYFQYLLLAEESGIVGFGSRWIAG